jgi:hypothetical protein
LGTASSFDMVGASIDGTISTGASMATVFGSLVAWVSRRRYEEACEASESGSREAWGQRASRCSPPRPGIVLTESQQFCRLRVGPPEPLDFFSGDSAGCEQM